MNDRTYYSFDKQPRYNPKRRMRFFVCRSADCRQVVHYLPKRGQVRCWCSARCYVRERMRRLTGKRGKLRGPYKRHKGVLGTAHFTF